MLKSRRLKPSEFVEEFFQTLTPGVIPRNQFIDWGQIKTKCRQYEDAIAFYDRVRKLGPEKFVSEVADSLLSSDEPRELLKGAFELLGHTADYYVSDQDNLELADVTEAIRKGSEAKAKFCAQLLLDLGILNLNQKDLPSTFLGVQVGLETNRRKNVGGDVFNNWVRELLESTCSLLGREYSFQPELRIQYRDSKNGKRVDFAILHKEKVRFGIEVNFYTTPGSKPTEIKRAYANVTRELRQVGVDLIWITDGAGYFKMRKSLEEAFTTHANTYNYNMARQYLKEDILDAAGH